jgi:hypothetical protein
MAQITLRVGDELVEPALFAHKMTYVGPIGPAGEDVVDPANGQPARLIHFYSIPNREQLRVGERGPEDYSEQVRVQARAREVVGKGIVNRTFWPNCEHIDSYIRKGKPESPQLRVGVGLGLAILVLCLLGSAA